MPGSVENENRQPEEQSPEGTEQGSPVPDPERDDDGDADEVPTAD
jgi:hypothetical protein